MPIIPSVYINLEDDVSKVVERLKRVQPEQVVLVCPKRCFLFSDSINLRLLKKQTDLLGKEVYILTMDERGQMYAKEAGFGLKFLPKNPGASRFSDIKVHRPAEADLKTEAQHEPSVRSDQPNRERSRFPKPVKPVIHKITETKMGLSGASPRVRVTDAIFPAETEDLFLAKKQSRSRRLLGAAFVTLCLVVIVAVIFVVLPSAAVAVYPKTQPITRDMSITAAMVNTGVDASHLSLPAAKVDETVEVSDKFQSQGKKEVGNKSMGTIRIYNFTRAPINLKASTTTLNIGGKNYSLTEDALGVKPTAYKNAAAREVDLASLSGPYEVVAAEGGESYNVPAGARMEVTNQVFGSKPQFLYAKTETAVTGGTTRFLSVISQQDVANAQNMLADAAIKQIKSKLESQGLALLDKSYAAQPVSYVTDNPAGTQSPSFAATLKLKVTGLAFKWEDLTKLITDRIGQTLPPNTSLVIKNNDHVSTQAQTFDASSGTFAFSVHFEGSAVAKINLDNVARDLAGKTKNQANDILRSRADVDKIEMVLSPSWQTSFPWFANKINVTVVQP